MNFKTPEAFHQKMSFVFHAMIALPLAFFVYLFLEIRNNGLEPIIKEVPSAQVLTIILPVLAMVEVVVGNIIFKKRIALLEMEELLKNKLSNYFQYSVVFYGFILSACVLLVLGLYLTTSAVFIITYVVVLFWMSLNRPTPQKYITDLRLKKEYRDIMLRRKEFDLDSEG